MNGRRVSTYTAFIKPFEKKREKLRIERYSDVSEILINEKKRAYGVSYLRHGIPQIAHASKEIIISCGTFGSPLLLMKSGIGPSNTLKAAGIPLVTDLPVGKIMYDHTTIYIGPFSIQNISLIRNLKTITTKDLIEFQEFGHGLLASAVAGGQAFIVSSAGKRNRQPNWPDLQFYLLDVFPTIYDSNVPSILINIAQTRPRSKGFFKLNITAYKTGMRKNEDIAIIDYNILSDPSDADTLLEATSWLHTTSTCKMGFGENDKTGVLDSKLNVLGISNLKVVDASIMPVPPNSNPAAPIIMIAEKISDEILKIWK